MGSILVTNFTASRTKVRYALLYKLGGPMTPVITRQEMYMAVEKAKNSILASMATKSDVQAAMAQVRAGIVNDMRGLHSENQAVIQNNQARYDILNQRLTMIERNVQIIAHELARLSDSLGKISNGLEGRTSDTSGYYYQRI
jgi:hypothetical protein